MKICQVKFAYYPGQGATGIYEFTRALAALKVDTHSIAVRREHEPELETVNNVTVHRIHALTRGPRKQLTKLCFFFRAAKIIRQGGFDIVHVFTTLGAFVLPLICQSDSKWAYYVQSGAVISHSSLLTWFENAVKKHQSRFFDSTIVISEALRERLFGSVDDKIFVVPIGVNLSRFRPIPEARSEIRRRYQIAEDDVLLVYSGAIERTRQLDIVLRAFQQAFRRAERVSLMFVGSGADVPRLRKIAQDLDIANRVVFTGYASYEQMPAYLSAADIGLSYLPAGPQYAPQPTLKVAEYLACGLPVVATTTYGHWLHIEDEFNGLLAQPNAQAFAQCILRLVEDGGLRIKMASRARDSIAAYDWDTIVKEKLLPAYTKILERPGK